MIFRICATWPPIGFGKRVRFGLATVGESIGAGFWRASTQENAMPIEPRRQNALQCRELAERAQRLAQAQMFLNLAKQWVQLAVELEHAQALRK